MYLHTLSLTNFRSYNQADFEFSPDLTVVIGPNTAGKTNLLEAIVLLATGRSFSEHHGEHLIQSGNESFHLEAVLEKGEQSGATQLGVNAVYDGEDTNRVRKKYVVEGVGRKRKSFASNFQVVYFGPEEIRLILGSPSRRRDYLDSILFAVAVDYSSIASKYRKARIQRNNLLKAMQKGNSNGTDWHLWTERVVELGNKITRGRTELVNKLNQVLSKNKYGVLDSLLLKYNPEVLDLDKFREVRKDEVRLGTTILGPHRDDFSFTRINANTEGSQIETNNRAIDLSVYGSRGEQRLAVTALKLAELEVRSQITGERPILLLDDVFSELDAENRVGILEVIPKQQTIVTTTNPDIVRKYFKERSVVIELGK